MKDKDDSLSVDYAFIEVFGYPMRDEEMLSCEGLTFNTILRRIEKKND